MATLKKMTRVGADVRQIARLLQAKAPEGHMLAYITPEEAEMLKSQGGSGKPHADTGVPSFEVGATGGADYGDFYGQQEVQPSPEPVQARSDLPVASVTAPAFDAAAPAASADYFQFAPQPSPTAAPAPAVAVTPAYTGDMGMYAGAFPVGSFERAPGPSGPEYRIDTSKPAEEKGIMQRLTEATGLKEDTLARLGLGGLQAVLGARTARRATEQGRESKAEQQALARPYQAKGAELQRAAQAGELTPAGQQQMQAVQAQLAQQATARGGVGAAQSAAQIEAFRNQLLQQQYDYGLKLSGIGDQIALGAIKTGMQADQYVNQLTANYVNNITRTLYGQVPESQQKTQAGVV